LLETYGRPDDAALNRVEEDEQEDDMQDLEDLRERATLSPLDWFLILFMATFLLGVPFILAFLTAFFTPPVGLACRSLTFTVYACAQFTQVFLWLWAYAGAPGRMKQPDTTENSTGTLAIFWRGGWLERRGFYDPTNTDYFRDIRSILTCLWYTLYISSGMIASGLPWAGP
jgi:hypothetical protein